MKAKVVEVRDYWKYRWYSLLDVVLDEDGGVADRVWPCPSGVKVMKGTWKERFMMAWFRHHRWIDMDRYCGEAWIWLEPEDGDVEMLKLASYLPGKCWGVWKKALEILKEEGRRAALRYLEDMAVIHALVGV